jgi:hypothetical protein
MRKLSRPKLIVRGPEETAENCRVNVPEPVKPVTNCHVDVPEPVRPGARCTVTVQEPVKSANVQDSNLQFFCNSAVMVIDPEEAVCSSDAPTTDTSSSSDLETRNKKVRFYY